MFNTSGEVIGIAARTIEEGQNLNFAIPIDYAKGMLNSNQAQPLSAFYEPEPQTEGTATEQPTNESVPLPLEPSKNLAAFLTSKLGQWKTPDVLKALGKPIREYTTEGPEAMKKYEYGDSTNLWRGIRLTFEHGTDWLIAVATYPWNMTVAQMKVLFGENFKTYKVEKDGTIMYAYVDRPLLVSANDLGAVDSLTTFIPGMKLADVGVPTTATPGVAVPTVVTPREETRDATTEVTFDVNGLKSKLGVLTLDEAIKDFGQPYRRYVMPEKKRADDVEVCYFIDRTRTVRRIVLMFKANSKRLDSIGLYPYSTKSSELAAQLGRNYKIKPANGNMTEYFYKDKPVMLLVQPNDDTFLFSISRSTPLWRALNGEEAKIDWTVTLRKPTRRERLQAGQPAGSPSTDFARSRDERILLLERNLGIWTFDDARREFGPAATQKPVGDRSNNSDADLYGFRDAAGGFPLLSLSFYRASGKLVTATLTPAGMNREQLIGLLGADYAEAQDSNGNRVYRYRDRPINATVDSLGNVVSALISLEI